MNLKELIALIPEANRAQAETVIADAVKAGNPIADIDSNEKAASFIAGNKYFKGAYDAGISEKVLNHDTAFMKDKFPKLVEAEIKKLTGPETDPLKLRVAELEARDLKREEEIKREKLTATALKIAASEGIPVDDVARFLDEDEAKTTESVKSYAARMKKWAQSQTDAILKERLGNVGKPQGGNTQPAGDLESQYKAAVAAGNADMALVLQGKLQAQAASNHRS